MFMRPLNEIIKELREKKGSQGAVALKLSRTNAGQRAKNGFSSQLLGQYEKGRQKPKLLFLQAWKEAFGEDLLAIQEETNVSHETKSYNMQKPDDNEETTKADVYRTIVEGETEYLLIPRSVLQDKYRLRSLEDIAKDEKVLDKLLDANEKMLARLLAIDPKFAGVEQGKHNS